MIQLWISMIMDIHDYDELWISMIKLRYSICKRRKMTIIRYGGYLSKHIVNTLRPRQNGRNFADEIFKCIFLNENVWISINISLKFVPKGLINNIPALVQIMAWRRTGVKPLSEPMVTQFNDAYMRHSASMSQHYVGIMSNYNVWFKVTENLRILW